MKKILSIVFVLILSNAILAQTKTSKSTKKSKVTKTKQIKRITPPVITEQEQPDNVTGIVVNTTMAEPRTQKGEPMGPYQSNEELLLVPENSIIQENPDIKASFPGGDAKFYAYLSDRIEFPVRCMEEGISGTVKLRFVVDVQGKISQITVLEEKRSCPEFTKEAIRVIRQSPKWIPAQIKGKFVNSWMMIPVTFNLE